MTLLDIVFVGIGLAVDASCVSACNGLAYKSRLLDTIKIALVFAVFQVVMPLLGYLGVGLFSFKLLDYNHFMALILLSLLGVKMIYESLKEDDDLQKNMLQGRSVTQQGVIEPNVECGKKLSINILIAQGITTSIDALSVGITFNNFDAKFVLYAVAIIGIITFIMCAISVRIGREIGTKLNTKAELIGGLVLILIGIKLGFFYAI